MFCVKNDVMTLESIEMYGFVTAWTSMDDGPYWVILLMYESHEMRHTGFLQVDGGQRDPRVEVSQHGIRTYVYDYLGLEGHELRPWSLRCV